MARNLRALLEPARAPERTADGGWACGGAVARVADGALRVTGDGADGIDGLKAALDAAWEAADSGLDTADMALPEFAAL